MKVEIPVEERETVLQHVVQELYSVAERIIEPLYPWVLVRIMPKEQQVGSIFLVEKQNKTFYEGIVLAIWKPFWKEYTGDLKFDMDAEDKMFSHRVVNKRVQIKSGVEVGDRIMFMHFEGQPVPYLDELHYRMIHEVETHPNGGIWGKLHLQEDTGLKEKLDKMFKNKTCCTVSGK